MNQRFALGLSIVVACGGSSSPEPVACTTGDEACACYPNRTCNDGFVCRSSVCIVDAVDAGGSENALPVEKDASVEVSGGGGDDAGAGGRGGSGGDASFTDVGAETPDVGGTGGDATSDASPAHEAANDGEAGDGPAETLLPDAGPNPPLGHMPAHLSVGLSSEGDPDWLKNSGVPWDLGYKYITKGWVDWVPNGQYALDYMRESDSQGRMPVLELYQLDGESPSSSPSQLYNKTKNATMMAGYFADVRTLMQRAREFAKPVLVLVELEGFAFLETQTADNPNAVAAVASTGVPELAGLPNTVTGFGLGFLAMRRAVGATNVLLGMHVAHWSSGTDAINGAPANALATLVDKSYAFDAPLGLSPNATGDTYDVLVSDPSDRDADYYRLVMGDTGNHVWDPSDTAPLSTRSFNRYAEWLRLWYVKTAKPWVLFQLPCGNSNHLNVNNLGQPRQGYKDNRAEYFFASDSDGGATAAVRRGRFVDVGVVSLLFGPGAGAQSSFENDNYTGGELFLKTYAGAYLQNPLALP